MPYLTANVTIADVYVSPDSMSELADEVLFGMTVEILEETGNFYKIRTHYRYEGYSLKTNFIVPNPGWAAAEKVTAEKAFIDVMDAPDVTAGKLAVVPRGGMLVPEKNGAVTDASWQAVRLPNGAVGFARSRNLMMLPTSPIGADEDEFRGALVRAAKSYMGTQYRWGGKTAQGIDCSGLVSVAYMLCGVLIYRDASIQTGFPIRELPFEEIKPGDPIFFTGHVAMYIGGGEYIHSTGREGSDGVVINSFDPNSPLYREDLPKIIRYCGRFEEL